MPGVNSDRRADAETAAAARAEARALCRAGREAEAEQVLAALGASWSQAYQLVGDLVVEVPGAAPGPRELDLGASLHRVRTADGEHVTLVSVADTATLQFILGQRDMGEWDAFLGELEASGLESYVELINGARDRFVDGS